MNIMDQFDFIRVRLMMPHSDRSTAVYPYTGRAGLTVDNVTFEGNFVQGIIKGLGVAKSIGSETQYDGNWLDGRRSGRGVMTWPDSEKYTGDWKDGRRHGQGRMVFSSKDVYEGQWTSDEMTGKGTMDFNSQSAFLRYSGDFVKGVAEGYGTMQFRNNDVYTGTFHNNTIHGMGRMVYKNGSVYEGSWVSGLRNGLGTMTFTEDKYFCDTLSYAGQWHNDNISGIGRVVYGDGSSFEGWVESTDLNQIDDIDQIEGRSYDKSGKLIEDY